MPPHKPVCIPVIYTDIGPNPTLDDADTLIQAQFISACLMERGYDSPLLPYRPATLKSELQALNAAAVFNLVESVSGEDSRAPEGAAFFEALGIPYSGNSATTLNALITKPDVKRRLQQHNLPTPAFPEDGGQGRQWILKSETFHCSLGMDHRNVSGDIAALKELAKECAAKHGGEWFLEEYIPGREINMAILDNGDGTGKVLPASEIRFHGREPHIVDYDSKWNEESESYNSSTVNMVFSDADKPMLNKLGTLTERCWKAFDLSGYARVDFRIDPAGHPYILEINANPCLSSDAGFMRAAHYGGMTPADVIARLVAPLLKTEKNNEARIA